MTSFLLRFKFLQEHPSENHTVLVGRYYDATVGYLSYQVHSPRYFKCCSAFGYLDQLAVNAKYRGKGFGKELCNHALDDFTKQGLLYARVITTTPNDLGPKFYQKQLSFDHATRIKTPTGTEDWWRKDLRAPMSTGEAVFSASLNQKGRYCRTIVKTLLRK